VLVENLTAPPADFLKTMALLALMQAKVTCTNAIHELDTIDCFTDDWVISYPCKSYVLEQN
jgi:hypothetical protein